MAAAEEGDDDGSSADDSADVFCICRRPDNHKWMIACDGGCEDWFHGSCVHIKEEDGNLIDKYICPGCEAKGQGETTWKPMCRRLGCRKPARLTKGKASKYCSDACGLDFFKGVLDNSKRKQETISTDGNGRKKAAAAKARRKSKSSPDRDDFSDDGSEYVDLGPRGGAIRPREIKALATSAPDVASFRALGDGIGSSIGVLFAPNTASINDNGDKSAGGAGTPDFALNEAERTRLTEMSVAKADLRRRRELLRDRERFVAKVREITASYAEREGLKAKDVCGFDSRLSWSEVEFARWREGKGGSEMLGGKEGASDRADEKDDSDKANDGGVNASTPVPPDVTTLCTRKRCERHKQWQKLAIQDVKFEEADVAGELRRLEGEEKETRERALLRWREEQAAAGNGVGGEVIEVSNEEEAGNQETHRGERMEGVEFASRVVEEREKIEDAGRMEGVEIHVEQA